MRFVSIFIGLTISGAFLALNFVHASEETNPWGELAAQVEQQHTIRGGVDSGGGDGFTAEFFSYARLAAHLARPRWYFPGIPFERFEALLLSVVIESDYKILRDNNNIERDALNFPNENRILINRLRWKELSSDNKLLLALHEYLGLLRIPDLDFQTSQALLNLQKASSRQDSPNVPVACPDDLEKARLRAFVNHVGDLNGKNLEWLEKVSNAALDMIWDFRQMNGERVRLSPDPIPIMEQSIIATKSLSVIGIEAMEEELIKWFPPQCKSGVAKAIRLFLPVEQEHARQTRIRLEMWKESLKTILKFFKEQDLKSPTRTYNRATLIFMYEVMHNHLKEGVREYSRLNSYLTSLNTAFMAADE